MQHFIRMLFWQREKNYLFDKKVIALSNENAIWSVKTDSSFPRKNWTAYLPTILIYPWQIMVSSGLRKTIIYVQHEPWEN